MSLIRWEEKNWDPFRELETMNTRLNRLFARHMPQMTTDLSGGTWTPAVNIAETDRNYTVSAELPEVKKEDVHVKLEGNLLTIEGERKAEKEEKNKRFHRVESFYGSFVRQFTLPEDAENARIEANFKDGMLHVIIPKSASKKVPTTEVKIH